MLEKIKSMRTKYSKVLEIIISSPKDQLKAHTKKFYAYLPAIRGEPEYDINYFNFFILALLIFSVIFFVKKNLHLYSRMKTFIYKRWPILAISILTAIIFVQLALNILMPLMDKLYLEHRAEKFFKTMFVEKVYR